LPKNQKPKASQGKSKRTGVGYIDSLVSYKPQKRLFSGGVIARLIFSMIHELQAPKAAF